MIFKLEFQPSSVTPPPDSQGKKCLVICNEGDYFLGHPMFDDEGSFLCFIVDEVGASGFPFHQQDYVAWASLPDTRDVTER